MKEKHENDVDLWHFIIHLTLYGIFRILSFFLYSISDKSISDGTWRIDLDFYYDQWIQFWFDAIKR